MAHPVLSVTFMAMHPEYPVAHVADAVSEVLDIDSTSTTTEASAVRGKTIVRLISTADCDVSFGPSADAETDEVLIRIVSSTPEYFALSVGDKVSVITAAHE